MNWRSAFIALKAESIAPCGIPSACAHLKSEVRAVKVAGGAKQYASQCLECGERVGSAISQVRWHEQNGPKEPAAFDEQLRDFQRDVRSWNPKQIREERHRAFWDLYTRYLRSAEWADKRRAVLERDNGMCGGCLERSAQQVHHRTYEHVGDELLFELVSLCHRCHDKCHEDQHSEAA